MGFLSNLKQLLPPSSRSFHSMYREMVESNWIVKDTGLKLYDMDYQFNKRLDELEAKLATHDTHMKMLSWAQYRKEGESLDDAKKRFFRELPPASGASRLLQLGCLQLLTEFDELCQANGLTYWATWGTLLGAVRHEGFIPWDDDVDLGMMREDILTLIDLVADSDRFKVSVVYDRWFACRQVRFKYRDESIPCFLDLFIHDYASTSDVAQLEALHQEGRARLEEEATSSDTTAHWTFENASIASESDEAAPIREIFDRHLEEQAKDGVILPNRSEEAESLVWAIDNIYEAEPGHWRVWKLKDAFPTVQLPFEGRSIPVFCNYQSFLAEQFDDYLSLPADINGHGIVHVEEGALDSAETIAKMEELIG